VKHVFSAAFGWTPCGSVGAGGADVSRDWSPLDATHTAACAWADPDPAAAEPAAAFLVSGHRAPCLVAVAASEARAHPLRFDPPGPARPGMLARLAGLDPPTARIPAAATAAVADAAADGAQGT
jgi:hypothetical protein